MTSVSILIIILIVVIIILRKDKNRLTNINEKIQLLTDAYHHMKTGDLIFITNKDYKIKLCYLIVVDDSHIKIIQRKDSGYLFLESIDIILDKYVNKKDYKIILFKILEKITNEQKQELTNSLHEFYPPSQPINVVLRLGEKSIDYFKCPFFVAKILLKLDLLKLGTNVNCISDPSECLQEFYKNSSFLIAEQYRTDDIIELVDSY